MDFIADNYMWAIIIVIVVLMAIVGYIADKTDFGRKEFAKKVTSEKPKKEKVKKEKPKKEKKSDVIEELPVVFEESVNNGISDIPAEQEPISQDLSVDDFGQNFSNDVQEVGEDVQLENVASFDLNNDINNVSEENTDIDQSLFEPLPSIDQVFSEPLSTNEDVVINDENISLTDSNVQESEVESDDDIWKF